MMKTVLWTLLTLIGAYAALVLLVFVLQKKLIFHPTRTISYDPRSIGLEYEEVTFNTEDDVTLHGWYIPHEKARGTVLFLHGNAGDIGDRLDTIQQLHHLRLNHFIFDYRGYGKSGGSPTEKGLYRDARAAYEYLKDQKNVDTNQLIIMGRSLGGAVASWLAAHVSCRLVILESTFTSAPQVAAEIYPYLPARYMIRYRFPVKKWVQKLRVPILIAHSVDDKLIPYSHGKELYDAAYPPKKFLKLQGDHASAFMDSGDRYGETLNDFLKKHLPPEY